MRRLIRAFPCNVKAWKAVESPSRRNCAALTAYPKRTHNRVTGKFSKDSARGRHAPGNSGFAYEPEHVEAAIRTSCPARCLCSGRARVVGCRCSGPRLGRLVAMVPARAAADAARAGLPAAAGRDAAGQSTPSPRPAAAGARILRDRFRASRRVMASAAASACSWSAAWWRRRRAATRAETCCRGSRTTCASWSATTSWRNNSSTARTAGTSSCSRGRSSASRLHPARRRGGCQSPAARRSRGAAPADHGYGQPLVPGRHHP